MNVIETILSELSEALASVSENIIDELCNLFLSANKIMFCGYGRSGLVARCIAMRLAQMGLSVQVVGETTTTAIESRDLLVSISASGKTGNLCEIQKKAKEFNANTVAVTGTPDSELAKNADYVLLLNKVDNKSSDVRQSIQPLGSLFEQSCLMIFDGVVLSLMTRMGKKSEDLRRRHANLE